jgi:hypothetical protein
MVKISIQEMEDGTSTTRYSFHFSHENIFYMTWLKAILTQVINSNNTNAFSEICAAYKDREMGRGKLLCTM